MSDCEFVAGDLFFEGFGLDLVDAGGLTILVSAVSAASSNSANFAGTGLEFLGVVGFEFWAEGDVGLALRFLT